MKEIQNVVSNSKLNKENIETNFKNIIGNFSGKISFISEEIDNVKKNQETIKNPLVEYCDMLTKEIQHLNQQSKNHQIQIHKIIREARENVRFDSKLNSVSNNFDHSIMLPNIASEGDHHNSLSFPLDSNRNKSHNLNLSTDNAYRNKEKGNKTDLEKMSKINKLKYNIKKGNENRQNQSGHYDKKLNLNKFEFMSLESDRHSDIRINGNDSIMKNF
mmetsp:Transcript_17157/g.14103  ORF Transcript_17157/g.14103 Transcript_17157/m.14103 type:complete len:217 (+) Transcript_17157:2057-2707(+)